MTMPNGWRKIPLKDIVDAVVDNRGRNPDYYVPKGIPVIDNVLIKGERKIGLAEAKRFIDNKTYLSFIRKYNQKNDVLITLVGNGYGNVALSPKEKSIIMQNTIGLRCNDLGDNVFLFYNLSLNKRLLADLNIGAAQPSIKVGDLLNIELIAPPLPEQKAIADVLSSLDDKIELLREQNKTLECLAQTIFKEWFVNFNFPNEEGKPYKSSGGKMIDSELGEIPEGWRVGVLQDIIQILNGFAFKSEDYEKDGIPIVRTTNFNNGTIQLDDVVYLSERKAEEYKQFYLKKYDYLLVMVGASIGKSVIAPSHILPSLQNQNMWNFRPKKEKMKFYCNLFLEKLVKEQANSAGGSARDFFRKDYFYSLSILIPDSDVVEVFYNLVLPIFEKIDSNELHIQPLSKLRDAILPKLMSGGIRVNGF